MQLQLQLQLHGTPPFQGQYLLVTDCMPLCSLLKTIKITAASNAGGA